jgi:F0F1-type ATP synthase membrane subunit b/b'
MTELENEFTSPEDVTPEPETTGLDIDPIKSPGDIAEPMLPAEETIPEVIESEPEQEPVPEPEEPKGESKVRLFFRRLLRWTLGLLIIFGLGFLTAVFALYRPELQKYNQNLDKIRGELTSAQEQLDKNETEYQNQITELENQVATLKPLASANEELMTEQNGYQLHTAILNARLDVAYAQLALAADDTARARVVLTKTSDTLLMINDLLPENQQGVIVALEQRLDLVLSEVEEDPYAAQSDLDVLEKGLLELEDALFGE